MSNAAGARPWPNPFLDPAHYEATSVLAEIPTNQLSAFEPRQGILLHRDTAGGIASATVRVLSDNPSNQIVFLCAYNGWGRALTDGDHLRPVPGSPYFEATLRAPEHGMRYRLLLNGQQVLDPAAALYTTPGYLARSGGADQPPYRDAVLWDFDRPDAYRVQRPLVDLRRDPVLICETEVFDLVRRWRVGDQIGPRAPAETYRFVAECGVIEELARIGYNAIELLPVNQSLDGDRWQLRYLVFGPFAPDSRYGTPDEFARMVDRFNQSGIAVLLDAVLGHYPAQGNDGCRQIAPIALTPWRKACGQGLYGHVLSPWGTYRYDYANPYVRRFLIDSVLFMMKRYGISGLRIDNLDGIMDYEGGGGVTFVEDLVREVRAYRPEALLIGELYTPAQRVLRSRHAGGIGMSRRTHACFFDFIKDSLQKRTEEIDMGVLRNVLRGPWCWQEAPGVQYVTNHDEAANPRDGATGAYLASLLEGGGRYFILRKTIAFESLAMLSAVSHLDMPQKRLLQPGNLSWDPAVDWTLRHKDDHRHAYDYFARLATLLRETPAFSLINYHPGVENHTDHQNKVVSLERIDFSADRRYYALINLGHHALPAYRFGVSAGGAYRVLLASDAAEFGGTDQLRTLAPSGVLEASEQGEHGKACSLVVPSLAPYGVVLLAQEGR